MLEKEIWCDCHRTLWLGRPGYILASHNRWRPAVRQFDNQPYSDCGSLASGQRWPDSSWHASEKHNRWCWSKRPNQPLAQSSDPSHPSSTVGVDTWQWVSAYWAIRNGVGSDGSILAPSNIVRGSRVQECGFPFQHSVTLRRSFWNPSQDVVDAFDQFALELLLDSCSRPPGGVSPRSLPDLDDLLFYTVAATSAPHWPTSLFSLQWLGPLIHLPLRWSFADALPSLFVYS